MKEPAQLLLVAEELLQHRLIADAKRSFDLAESAGGDPDQCSGGRWLAAMLSGDFERAWLESDALRWRNSADPHRLWGGEDLRGKKLMVRCLHGFGDAVQMLRFAPILSARAADVIFEVPPKLVGITLCFLGVHQVITWGADAPSDPPPWDVQVEIMELPYLLRTTCADLPVATQYLRIPDAESAQVLKSMGDRRGVRVGLVWGAGEWNQTRSIPASLLLPLLAVEGVEFWSLQGGSQAAEAEVYGLSDVNAICGAGIMKLAATISQLDLVITVDTLAAHLAGALGKKVWLMLQFAADWRWMIDREDSPWYPTMRLFRQSKNGGWPPLIDAVATALREEVR